MSTEVWKQIKGFEGLYEISNCGRVKSLARSWISGKGLVRTKPDTILKSRLNHSGYLYVVLSKVGKQKSKTIHAICWDNLGDKPRNCKIHHVDHIDNQKTNNRIDNLQLLTARENAVKYHKTQKRSSKFTGVYWNKRLKKWKAQINQNNNKIYLGIFSNEYNAYIAYKKALNEILNNKFIPKKRETTSKLIGVSWSKTSNKWKSTRYINGKNRHLGYYINEYLAYLAYQKALKALT